MKTIAYFCAEFAIDQNLHTYSGGLGVVAGSYLRAAYNLGLPVVAVSIFWSEGYYEQEIGVGENNKPTIQIRYEKRGYGDLIDTGLLLDAVICNSPVKIRVLKVPAEKYKICPTYLLDVDIPENNWDPPCQLDTRRLYQGNEDRKLAQKIILAKGIEALERLGYQIDIYHLNEGFCVLAGIELLRRELNKGLDFEEALKTIKNKIVFTTHTPEKAGNEIHSVDDMYRMGCLDDIPRECAIKLGEGDKFNATDALLKMAKISNGVSNLHAKTAQKMWAPGTSAIIPITNGIDKNFWQYENFRGVCSIEGLMGCKLKHKKNLLRYTAAATDKYLNENILTIVWARRFAEYKRPRLILHELSKVLPLLQQNKIQIIYAGKPHPDDNPMIDAFNYILKLSNMYPNLVILSGYELELNKILKAGADIWLNTPRLPHEACGTSGISAAWNGAINVATRDGIYLEFINDNNGFLFGVDHAMINYQQDKEDAESLYDLLPILIDAYYNNEEKWHEIALEGMKTADEFTADRMIKEYSEKMYEYEA